MSIINTLTLNGGNIGIEREMLRVKTDATLADTMHPETLGKTLTHPHITTDFAETLVELVTDVAQSPEQAYQALLDLHRYTQSHIGDERFWATSMPCVLPDDLNDIELGYYGETNSGKIKRLYRKGLSLRYGRAMQMIAGVHFNYSPPSTLWTQLAQADNTALNQAYINDRYLGMVRNLQRYGWIICYLFGASPATHTSFQPAHGVLHPFNTTTLGWHNATSLRMSDLGYQNKVLFTVSLNDLDTYIRDLVTAVMTPAPIFQHDGIKNAQGEYQQISPNILQISNEYYSGARPKQVLKSGEAPIVALKERGIAYVELRLLDVNPFDPCGVSLSQMQFLETFMLWCLLSPSPQFNHSDRNEINSNRLRVACCGEDENMHLDDRGNPRTAREWILDILDDIQPIARQLDNNQQRHTYRQVLQQLINDVRQQTLIPNRVHQALRQQPFIDWAQQLSEQHRPTLSQTLDAATQAQFDAIRDQSISTYNSLQAEAQAPFADFLAHYFDPIKHLR